MRRNFTKGLMAGALALAGLGASQGVQANLAQAPSAVTVNSNSKAITARKETKGAITISPQTGGLDMQNPLIWGNYGMSPKEYGMRFGTGASKKHKSNRNRYAHNAKLKRRLA